MAIGDSVTVTVAITFEGNDEADLGRRQGRLTREVVKALYNSAIPDRIERIVSGQPTLQWLGARSHYRLAARRRKEGA